MKLKKAQQFNLNYYLCLTVICMGIILLGYFANAIMFFGVGSLIRVVIIEANTRTDDPDNYHSETNKMIRDIVRDINYIKGKIK